jgi:DNA repair protein RecO (recombination protein O)
VARGARSLASRRGATFQPFVLLSVSWRESGELATLAAAEMTGEPITLIGERIFSGWYANELLLRLLPRRDPQTQLFIDYADLLQALNSEDNPQAALRCFEKHLLAELGYGLDLPDGIDPARGYRYDIDQGTLESGGEIPGSALIALREEHFASREDLRWARRLLQQALARQLGPGELQTPRLWRQLQRNRSPGNLADA